MSTCIVLICMCTRSTTTRVLLSPDRAGVGTKPIFLMIWVLGLARCTKVGMGLDLRMTYEHFGS